MKICVFGAGAIGGYLAVELSLAGHDVCVIARGEHLSAIAAKGLTLRIAGADKTARHAKRRCTITNDAQEKETKYAQGTVRS